MNKGVGKRQKVRSGAFKRKPGLTPGPSLKAEEAPGSVTGEDVQEIDLNARPLAPKAVSSFL